MQPLTYAQLMELWGYFESMFPDGYGYSEPSQNPSFDVCTYYMFRNRETSFNKDNALVIVKYSNG